MNAKELIEILSEYSPDTPIIIDRFEGEYISPNATSIVKVSVVSPDEEKWGGYEEEYRMDEEGIEALHIGLLE